MDLAARSEDNLESNRPVAAKPRLDDLDVAKGMAIVLVVFGHIVAREPPLDNEWYVRAKEAIYSFHMAFFMFVSGALFFLKAVRPAGLGDFGAKVWARFVRLMPAYFLFAAVVFLAKLGAQGILHVDNPVRGWQDLMGIAFFPMQSISAFLWYVYVLFAFSAVGYTLLSVFGGRLWPMVTIGAVLLFVPRIAFLGLDQFTKYFMFFALGGAAIRGWQSYVRTIDRIWPAAGLLLGLMLATRSYLGWVWVPTALVAIVALHGLCRRPFPFRDAMRYLGLLSFPIYLMNTLCIGLVKGVMLKVLSWDGLNFLVFAPVLTFAGLWLPILVKQHAFSRVRWLDRITT